MGYDLVISDGLIVDGTGSEAFRGDIGIQDGRIARIGRIREPSRERIDAGGRLVTPGFIDGHTHMDAQVNWDPLGSPSGCNGVTTAVMGNCGFTLAPARADQAHLVMRSLERSEDISPTAMAAGITWQWETFPEYLDYLDTLPKGINYVANIGHSALRSWVMGEASFERHATEDELVRMERQVEAAMQAGAVGFTSSRSESHQTADDRPVASRLACWSEVRRLVHAMARSGHGVFQIAPEGNSMQPDAEQREDFSRRLLELAVESGAPVTFGLVPVGSAREPWHDHLRLLDEAAARGGRIYGMTHPRGVSTLISFQTRTPFDSLPGWRELRSKPLAEQERLLRTAQVRESLVTAAEPVARKLEWDLIRVFDNPLGGNPTLKDLAEARNESPVAVMIDIAVERHLVCFFQHMIADTTEDELLEILGHAHTVPTFSDAGAHVNLIIDSTIQLYLLCHWVREKRAFSLEKAVSMVTSEPARIWNLEGRGLLREGMVADINVIDFDRLAPRVPMAANDLPTGAPRLVVESDGIDATIVGGQVVFRNGEHSGALPGRLVRPVRRAS